MAHLMEVTIVCDWCRVDDMTARTPVAGTITATIVGRAPRELDLCEQHLKRFEEFQAILDSQGRVPEKKSRASKVKTPKGTVVTCPQCGKQMLSSGLTRHLRVHNPNNTRTCPICRRQFANGIPGVRTHARLKHPDQYDLVVKETGGEWQPGHNLTGGPQ